jgi:signal transduction histidine kinase
VSGTPNRPGVPSAGRRFSLASAGARVHFDIAIALASVLPLLALMCLWAWEGDDLNGAWLPRVALVLAVFLFMALGFMVLGKYPLTIIRLRRYLDGVIRGEFPDQLTLVRGENDIVAIERNLNLVIDQLKQRVMTETLAAACHHLGQPATVITGYLELLRRDETQPDRRKMLDECLAAAADLDRVIKRMQALTHYKSVAYLSGIGDAAWSHDRLLDTEPAVPPPP